MLSSPACWARYGEVLAREYGTPALMPVHRLSVDAYAVQHPGSPTDRRAIQSVGLHLARLMLQLESPTPPAESNAMMLRLSAAKATLPPLDPPGAFPLTVADFPTDPSVETHRESVRRWAEETWAAWAAHHAFVRAWVVQVLAGR